MCRKKFPVFLSLAGLAALLAFSASARAENWTVTITNLTAVQAFTPIMVATHKAGVTLFTLGQPASTDMEHMAEAGDVSELEATLTANPLVKAVTDTGATLGPGKSVTITIQGGGVFKYLSVASMLIPTNAGFFALNGVFVSRFKALLKGGPGNKTLTFYSPAYDAGTEVDDELCIHIPGPPTVCTGEGFNADRTGAPNFVYIHSGIHGIGPDLPSALYNWKNPVAKIEVTLP